MKTFGTSDTWAEFRKFPLQCHIYNVRNNMKLIISELRALGCEG